MGGSHGKQRGKHKNKLKNCDQVTPEIQNIDEDLPEPELSEDDITMLKEMWTIVNQHVAKVGTVLFVE